MSSELYNLLTCPLKYWNASEYVWQLVMNFVVSCCWDCHVKIIIVSGRIGDAFSFFLTQRFPILPDTYQGRTRTQYVSGYRYAAWKPYQRIRDHQSHLVFWCHSWKKKVLMHLSPTPRFDLWWTDCVILFASEFMVGIVWYVHLVFTHHLYPISILGSKGIRSNWDNSHPWPIDLWT